MNTYSVMNERDIADYKAYLRSLIKPIKEEDVKCRTTFVKFVNNKNIERELASLG